MALVLRFHYFYPLNKLTTNLCIKYMLIYFLQFGNRRKLCENGYLGKKPDIR